MVVLFTGVVVLFVTQHRVAAEAPDFRVIRLGGVEYEAVQGRPIHPDNAVDGAIVAGLSASERRVTSRRCFGAFIAVTNDSSEPMRTAGRIELRDQSGRVYRALACPRRTRTRTRSGCSVPGTRIPAFGSVADDNLATAGRALVFRIRKWVYDNATLELVIHDPSQPGSTASLVV